jgi:hypothetical protein
MTNLNPLPPAVPGDDEAGADLDPTREVDGDDVLDEDANDDLIDSADADALATQPDEGTQ